MKKTWGRSTLKYCPIRKKVWQIKYDNNKLNHRLIVYNDMPTYGLTKEVAPEGMTEQIR